MLDLEPMLLQCWAIVEDAIPQATFPQIYGSQSMVVPKIILIRYCITPQIRLFIASPSQQTRGIHPILFQCWPNIETELGECLVFAGIDTCCPDLHFIIHMLCYCLER